MKKLALVLLAALVCCGAAWADIVNIDFDDHRLERGGVAGVYTYSGAAAIGAAGDVWNSVEPEWDTGEDTDLLNSAGAVTTVRIVLDDNFDTSNTANPDFSAEGLDDLFEDSSFTHPNTTAYATISGLTPNVAYTLYLYGVSDNAAQDSTFAVVGSNEGTQTVASPDLNGPLTLGDDYVVFTGTASATGTIDFSMTGGGLWCSMNGLQLDLGLPYMANSPAPENLATIDPPSSVTGLTWSAPDFTPYDVNVVSVDYDVYYYEISAYDPNSTDPNFAGVTPVNVTTEAYPESPATLALNYDKVYYWAVDTNIVWDSNEITGELSDTVIGPIWKFETALSVPTAVSQPEDQFVDPLATADFTFGVSSISTLSYKWYKYVDGVSDEDLTLSVDPDVSGADTETLSISNVETADEGQYYCIATNLAGSLKSDNASLGLKRLLAHWPFDSATDPNSIVAGSPATFVAAGTPTFLTEGVSGGAFSFSGAMFATDPAQADYFEPCSTAMTVACFVKSSTFADWTAYVSKYGEGSEGWQLRTSGNFAGKSCLTTRGTGADDNPESTTVIFDDAWHFVVGTFDSTAGQSKIYIDGALEGTASTSGTIGNTISPIGLAGRYVSGDDGVTWGASGMATIALDEVQIYNYAMTDTEVLQLMANLTGENACVTHPVGDIVPDCVVDILDFAELAKNWLTQTGVQPE